MSLLLLLISPLLAQKNYMDAIVNDACGCLEKVSTDLNTDQTTLELGLCIIEAALPYKEQILADYGINLENMDTEGGKLGNLIGVKMASVCPKLLVALSEQATEDKEDDTPKERFFSGQVTKINTDLFVNFTIKNEEGKSLKFYWLTFIKANDGMLQDYEKLKGKKVRIMYLQQEFFDPKIEEYRYFNVITSLSNP